MTCPIEVLTTIGQRGIMLAPGQFESEESPDKRGFLYHSSALWCPYEIVQYILFLYVTSEQWIFHEILQQKKWSLQLATLDK